MLPEYLPTPKFEHHCKPHYDSEIEPGEEFEKRDRVKLSNDEPQHDSEYPDEFNKHHKSREQKWHHVQFPLEQDLPHIHNPEEHEGFEKQRHLFNHDEIVLGEEVVAADHHVIFRVKKPPYHSPEQQKEFEEHRKQFNHGEIDPVKKVRVQHPVKLPDEDDVCPPSPHDPEEHEKCVVHRKEFVRDEVTPEVLARNV